MNERDKKITTQPGQFYIQNPPQSTGVPEKEKEIKRIKKSTDAFIS